jgi:DNA-binding response OmpR family regulator
MKNLRDKPILVIEDDPEILSTVVDILEAEGYAVEQRYTLRLARTADAREALTARRERRAPRFTGR